MHKPLTRPGKYILLLQNDIYYNLQDNDTVKVTTDHMVIKFREGITENDRSEFTLRHPVTFSGIATTNGIYLLYIDTLANFVDLIEEIHNDPDVQLYDINHLISLADVERPNDGYDEIDLQILYHENLLWPYRNTDLFEAWSLENGDSMIIVADIDNGLWIDHPEIAGSTAGHD